MGLAPNAAGAARPDTVRVAAVQMDVAIGDVEGNARRVAERLAEAASAGARLIVFPEAALSGYCFGSLTEAAPCCRTAADLRQRLEPLCRDLGCCCVIGFLETAAPAQSACWNSAILVGAGEPSVYRKSHLPTLGIDRFATPGGELAVTGTPIGQVGMLICYDIRFPEAARCLNLMGAEVLALPTNWPEGAESAPDFLTRARAWENRLFVIAANRVGVERGRRFIGRSQIVAPTGDVLCEAGASEETILYANLDLRQARQKRIVIEPGEWELDITGDRRPDLYGPLTDAAAAAGATG